MAEFGWIAGDLCLDFVNTTGWAEEDPFEDERLRRADDLVEWGRQSGLLTDLAAAAALQQAAADPAVAQRRLAAALRLREALHGIFAALARGEAPPSGPLDVLNRALSRTLGELRLGAETPAGGTPRGGPTAQPATSTGPTAGRTTSTGSTAGRTTSTGRTTGPPKSQGEAPAPSRSREDEAPLSWRWTDAGTPLDDLLRRVVWSAAQLLTSPRAARLKECSSPRCGWLFVDQSRRHNRRWCTMRECGSREKARRYYRRRRRQMRTAGTRRS